MEPPRSLAVAAPRGGRPDRDWQSQIPPSLDSQGAIRAAAPASASRSALTLAICMALPMCAQAALTENIAVDPVAMSMGNAVTADPPGLDSIHFNPAGLSRLEKNTRSDQFFGASLRVSADFH